MLRLNYLCSALTSLFITTFHNDYNLATMIKLGLKLLFIGCLVISTPVQSQVLDNPQQQSLDGFSVSLLTNTNFKYIGIGGGIEKYWEKKSIGITYTKSYENPVVIYGTGPEPYKKSDRIELNFAWYHFKRNTDDVIYFMTGLGYQNGIKRGEQLSSRLGVLFFPPSEYEEIKYQTLSIPIEVGWIFPGTKIYPKAGFSMNINFEDFYWPMVYLRLNFGKVRVLEP